jgi:hypothetical protein
MSAKELDDKDLEDVQGGNTIEPTGSGEAEGPRVYTGSPEVKKKEEDPYGNRGEGTPA